MAFQIKALAVLFDEEFLVIEAQTWLIALAIAINRYDTNGVRSLRTGRNGGCGGT